VDLLRVLRLGDPAVFRTALVDHDSRVRLPAVHGLVSLNQAELITAAAHEPVREVRIAVAEGLGAIRDPLSEPILAELSTNPIRCSGRRLRGRR
jgi:HEAT repeat protein